jgi:GntR family transcriptional regulator
MVRRCYPDWAGEPHDWACILIPCHYMSSRIDRSSALPFYAQLKQIIIDEIAAKQLTPGDRFMGDHELSSVYDVSRTVVRQALSELESEGVIDRVKGRGTFIAQQKNDEDLVRSLTGLYRDVVLSGSQLRSKIMRREVGPADESIADTLAIPVGTPVILIERLRFVDDEPWVLTVTRVPFDSAPGLLDDDLRETSLYALLESKYGMVISSGRRTLEAAVASNAQARSLGIAPGSPILVMHSVVFGDDGIPVETFVAYHRADRTRFEMKLGTPPGERAGSAALKILVSRPDE